VIGVIGSFNSGCAESQIPFLNRAPDGPLAMVSPVNSYLGLTRPDPFAPKGALASLYPTGVRNFARVYPIDDVSAVAAAIFVKSLGARKVFALADREAYGDTLARPFRIAAGRIGLDVVGSTGWDAGATRSAALIRRVKRSGADAVYLGGIIPAAVVKELRAQLGPRVRLIALDAYWPSPELFKRLGATAQTIYVTVLGVVDKKHLTPAGRRFADEFFTPGRSGEIDQYALYAAQAAEVMLDAIARSDGTRASVTKELLATRVRNGLSGSFRFDGNGDTTRQTVSILRPTRAGADRNLIGGGSVVVRVLDVPISLLR
jgi:branched-chain amino acid transport system substrate-binding protein